MEKKNELEKEERTVFIVLAIIILIAIGIILTWYFTKDKKLDDKDSDTKTKTVEKQKVKKIEKDEEEENLTNQEVGIVSTNLKKNTKAQIVNIAQTNDIEYTFGGVDNLYLYLVNERINFANFKWYNLSDVIDINNAKIKDVIGWDYENDNQQIKINYFDVTGKYFISEESKITFLEAGNYQITLIANNIEYKVDIHIYTEEELTEYIENELEYYTYFENNYKKEFFNTTSWDNFFEEVNNFKNLNVDLTTKRNAFLDLEKKFTELLDTYNNENEQPYWEVRNELNNIYEEINKKYSNVEDYNENEIYNPLKEILDKIKNILNKDIYSPTSDDVTELEELKTEIDKIIKELETIEEQNAYKKAVEDLNTLKESASQLKAEDYTEDSYKALKEILDKITSKDFENEEISIEEVNQLKEELQAAMNNLKEKTENEQEIQDLNLLEETEETNLN